jgi:hypothetical protein
VRRQRLLEETAVARGDSGCRRKERLLEEGGC